MQVAMKQSRHVGFASVLQCKEDMTEVKGVTLIRTFNDAVIVSCDPPKMGKFFLNIYVTDDWRLDAFVGTSPATSLVLPRR